MKDRLNDDDFTEKKNFFDENAEEKELILVV